MKRVHWRPEVPVSWPSGPGSMRTFLLASYIACPAKDKDTGLSTAEIAEVTCKRCLAIIRIARYDTPGTVREVLARGTADPVRPLSRRAAPPAGELEKVLADVLATISSYKDVGYESVDERTLSDDPEMRRAKEIEALVRDIERDVRNVAAKYGARSVLDEQRDQA